MVSCGEVGSYQLPRTDSCYVCSEGPLPRQEQLPHSPEDGQQDSSSICKPHGRDSLTTVEQCGYTALDMVSGERNNAVSRIPPRCGQPNSRHGVSDSPIFCRMAAPQGHLSELDARDLSVRRGSVCVTPEPPITPVHQLETGPLCYGDGCSADTMDQVEGLCIPTICPDQQGPQESTRGRVNNSPDSPGLGVPAMVSDPAVHAGGLSDSVTDPQRPPDRPIRPTPSISTVRPASTSRMDTIRQGYTTEGISTEAAQLLLSGWSKGTNTAYQSGWRKWVSWCMSREVDPISCPVHPFLDFLAGLFSEGLQYRSINTIRSAVSMTHKQVNGVPLGQHPLVSRLFKGMYNFRPPQPRYARTWDVDIVIQYFSSLGDNAALSLKQLSHKLATLMALVGANRVSELQALDLRFRLYRPDGVHFQLPSLGKKRTVGAPPRQVIFEAFPMDKRLCVAECLRCYEGRTSCFRSSGVDQPNQLFLSFIKPHKAVTSQTLAHWIKNTMEDAGIDTAIFKAHSVRGASSTAAAEKGVLMADILRTADWSKDSTFRRFYYRPTSGSGYAQTMLQQRERREEGKMPM